MSDHDEQMIDRAVRAMGRALAAGFDYKAAMRAALNAAASTGCLREYSVTVRGVKLLVGFDADIDGGWVITTAAGTDICQLADDGGELFQAIDRATCAAMDRESDCDALDRIEERHAARRALAGGL